jgi:hypothetical protein
VVVRKLSLLLWAVTLHAAAAPAPTFHKEIEPLLQRHCQICHRPGEAGPMPLVSYNQVRPWAKAIRDSVVTRRMPPWHADPAIGHFSNSPVLPAAEIALIRDWVAAGSPKGDPAAAPPPAQFAPGWTIPTPDQVFSIPEDFPVPATGELDYIHFAVPTGFTEDRWIQAIEVRPGTRAVVHHVGVYLRLPGSKWLPELKPGKATPIRDRTSTRSLRDELIAMYVPGAVGEVLAPHQGRRIPAGAELVFQIHYQTTGKAATDRTRVGVVFNKTKPAQRVYMLAVGNAGFVIPPGAADHPVRAETRLTIPTTVLNLIPHMHLRGKSFACRALLPDKSKPPVELVNVPRYDRNWQLAYRLAEPLAVPAGTTLQCDAVFDNSPNNPWNPDPTAEVRWGDQTREEMMVAYIDVVLPR